MGCGISKCMHSGEGTELGCHHFRIVHRKNGEDHEEEELAKEENVKSSDVKEEHGNEDENGDDEHEQDDSYHSIECPRSPSFRVFCTTSSTQNDSSKGEILVNNAEGIKDEQQYDVENNKKSSSHGTRKKSRAGKGIKSFQQKLHIF